MRSAISLLAINTLFSSSLAAQDTTTARPLVLAAGPAWTRYLTGVHLRGEYALLPDRWVSAHLEGGARWMPNQSFSLPFVLYQSGSGLQVTGRSQLVDVQVGVATTLTPWPRGRFSPYLVTGAVAVLSWQSGHTSYTSTDSSVGTHSYRRSAVGGELQDFAGIGLRLRIGARAFRVELRRSSERSDLTLATVLRL